MVKVQTPGILLTIWSRPVSGIAWTCSRVSTVVLTSSFSTSEPRPALTVTGGSVTGEGGGLGGVVGWVSCALANAGISARTPKAATVAARIDNMKYSSRQTNNCHAHGAHGGVSCQARRGGPRGWLGPSRMPTGVGCSEGSDGVAMAA